MRELAILRGAAAIVLGSLSAAAAGDPSHYARKATWYETLLASREAIRKEEEGSAPRIALPDLGRSDFTLCAWIRTEEPGGAIIAKAPAEGPWIRQGKVLFLRGGAPTFDVGWVGAVRAEAAVADGAWHHIALAGREPLEFYVDGVLVGKGALALGPDPAESVLQIGFSSPNFPESGGFRGEIDDVRVYGRRLAAEEIARARDDGTGRDPAPIGSWPLDGDGKEAMGTGLDGEIVGGAFVEGKRGKALRLGGRDRVLLPASEAEVARRRLWSLLARDFADPQALREMARERKDGIWDRDWPPGEWRKIAERYAARCEEKETRAEAAALAEKVDGVEALWKVRALYWMPPPIRFAEPTPLDADPGLVGWWKFDETSGTVAEDSSKRGRNGVLRGGLRFESASVHGRFGRALRFGGRAGAVAIPGWKGIAGPAPRTVGAWVQTKSRTGEIVSWGEDEPGRSWSFSFIRGRVGVTPKGGYLYMKEPVSDGAWHHVAVVVKEAEAPNLQDDVQLFLDGELAAIDDIGLLDLFPIDTGAGEDVTIGRGFDGAIDDLRIFDRALSEEEISALFRAKRR